MEMNLIDTGEEGTLAHEPALACDLFALGEGIFIRVYLLTRRVRPAERTDDRLEVLDEIV
jgi:hypothetical protein